VAALAKTVGVNRSTTGERLRKLSRDGAVEKDSAGRWKLKGEETGPAEAGEAARLTPPP
jgi:DNA-binding IclR family transcriptional regulator